MKKFLIATILGVGGLSATSYSQLPGDFSISISTIPAVTTLNQYVTYQVQILNFGPGTYPIRSVMATVQAPLNGKIVGFDNIVDTADWEIYSLTTTSNAGGGGNTAVIVNKVPLPDGYQAYPNLKMQAVAVLDGTFRNHVANVGYFTDPMGIDGPFPPNNAIYGNNDSNNDNSQSSLTVTQPLPLDFLSINAQWQSSDALVSWKVAREQDNEYFVVERSFDGKTFKEAGQVKSVGNHEEALSYSYTDIGVKLSTKEKVIYRIKQVDYSGKSTTSQYATLNTDKIGGGTANLFPNPAKSSVKFVYENYNLEGTQLLKVRLMDLQGRLLIEKELEIKSGSNELQLELSAFADGIYYLNYANDANTIKGSIRMMKG